jgi:class 3 adenylate cyclase
VNRTPRAVIADDEPLMRAQLRERLREAWPELEIAAEAKNGAEAVDLVAAQRPDFVFLDIRMPVKTGIEAAQAIARLGGALPDVVFVTAYDQHAIDAFEGGAVDYVLKPAERARLATTVGRLKARLALRSRKSAEELESLLARLAGQLASPAPAATQRRLAAILGADVVGYSRLMRADDEATHRALTEMRGLVARHAAAANGRVVNTAGDSVLAEFASVVDAVRCAVAIQRDMKGKPMQLRIGINVGDVLADASGIYGDGVNVAARVEALCPPGGVALSSNVYEQVRDKLQVSVTDHGEHEVKNIDRPVRIFLIEP